MGARGRLSFLGWALLAALLLTTPRPAAAQWADRWFVQAGSASQTRTLVVGAVWDWRWRRPLGRGEVTGYWELSFGRWSTSSPSGGNDSSYVTQFGVTPVLRWSPEAQPWFAEVGIGANFMAPVFRNRNKRFSTAFNFGDHIALGRRFGDGGTQELALRLQHFSNAGIKDPNPGENFVQLRWSRRF